MGGRGAFVDGVRRLFTRRNNSASTYLSDRTQKLDLEGEEEPERGEVEEEEEDDLKVVVDHDLTGLPSLSVPKRIAMAADSRKVSFTLICCFLFLVKIWDFDDLMLRSL